MTPRYLVIREAKEFIAKLPLHQQKHLEYEFNRAEQEALLILRAR